MDTSMLRKKVHHGHNLKRLREARGLKQESVAKDLRMTQQNISLYESQPLIEEDMLKRFAIVLGVPVDLIKDMEEDVATIIIENTTIETNNGIGVVGYHDDNSSHNHNPLDKIIELCHEKGELLERLLKTEQERNTELRQEIQRLQAIGAEITELRIKLDKHP